MFLQLIRSSKPSSGAAFAFIALLNTSAVWGKGSSISRTPVFDIVIEACYIISDTVEGYYAGRVEYASFEGFPQRPYWSLKSSGLVMKEMFQDG